VKETNPDYASFCVPSLTSMQLQHSHNNKHPASPMSVPSKILQSVKAVRSVKQEAQLPLREQGVSFVLSSHYNPIHGILAFSVYLYVTCGIFSKPRWQQTRASRQK